MRCVKLRNVVTLMRVCDAFEISPDQRATVEALLGRAIAQNEQISVRALPVAPEASPERRAEIIAEMDAYFARIDAKRSNLSDEEADELIMLDAE